MIELPVVSVVCFCGSCFCFGVSLCNAFWMRRIKKLRQAVGLP